MKRHTSDIRERCDTPQRPDVTDETHVLRWATLAGFADEADQHAGIAIQSLAPGTTVIVRTRNSKYNLTVTDDGLCGVDIHGGSLFPRVTSVRLQGATLGGSFVKIGWIQVGLNMELFVGSHRFVTSPVRSFTIESNQHESRLNH